MTIVTLYLFWDPDDWCRDTPKLTQQHVPVGSHGSQLPPPRTHGLLLCVPTCFPSNELISVLCFLPESSRTWLRSNYCCYAAHKIVEIMSWVQWPPLSWLFPSSENGTYKCIFQASTSSFCTTVWRCCLMGWNTAWGCSPHIGQENILEDTRIFFFWRWNS